MKTTISAFLPDVTDEQNQTLWRSMNKYTFMVRYAFGRLLEGMEKKPLEKYLSAETGLSIRHAKDAVEDARQTIKSQHEQVKLHLALWQSRLEKAEKKLAHLVKNGASALKIKGMEAKIEKRKRKVAFWQQHADDHTFPSVIFGGKKAFYDRCKGLMTKEQWQEKRNGRICSRGDATKKGNPNLRVIFQEDRFFLQINTDVKKGNGSHYEKMTLPLFIPRKISRKSGAINGRDYYGMMRDFLLTGKPYQVEILRKGGKYYVHITIEEQVAEIVTHPAFGVTGIDTNPDGLALCHVLPDGNPSAFQWIGDGGLQDAPSDKLENLIGHICKRVVLYAKDKGTALVVEDLRFIHDQEVSAKFHRLTHSFCYRRMLQSMERNALRYGVEFIKVQPAYTSVIGRLKYQPQYGMNVHHAAGLVIGRRGLGYRCERVPKALKEMCIAKNKQIRFLKMNNWKQWSAVKKSMIQKLKQKGGKLVSWLDHRKELFTIH